MRIVERLVASLTLASVGLLVLAFGLMRLGLGRHGDPIGALHWLRDGFAYAPGAHLANLALALLGIVLVATAGWLAFRGRRRDAANN